MFKPNFDVNDCFVCSVIVTYNPDLIIFSRQLQSLQGQVNHIVIVDNNSDNIENIQKEVNLLQSLYQINIELIKNSENVGLGKAQNQGIISAKTYKNITHVILFDQDSILNNGFVTGLLESEKNLLKQNIKVGAVGPVYYNETTLEVYPISRYNGPFIKRIVPTKDIEEATFLIASGCLIRLDVLDVVGFMDEELFIDYIDVEWSFRAKSLGYSVFASPYSKMSHSIGNNSKSILGRSISIHSPLRRYYLNRNSVYIMKKSKISLGFKIRELLFNFVRFIVFLFLSDHKLNYFKYSISGFRDGFRGIKGQCPHIYS